MKKIFLLFTMLFCFMTTTFAMDRYRATTFAYKQLYMGSWTRWSDWEKADVIIVIGDGQVKIFSIQPQYYTVVGEPTSLQNDDEGGQYKLYRAYRNSDNARCLIKLRIDPYNNYQIYIIYNDVQYVYGIVPN